MRTTPIQGICYKKKPKLRIQKLRLVLKFLVFFPLSTNNILAFVEDFKSIPVPSKEISSLAVEQIFEILTLLSYPLVVLLCHPRYESRIGAGLITLRTGAGLVHNRHTCFIMITLLMCILQTEDKEFKHDFLLDREDRL